MNVQERAINAVTVITRALTCEHGYSNEVAEGVRWCVTCGAILLGSQWWLPSSLFVIKQEMRAKE